MNKYNNTSIEYILAQNVHAFKQILTIEMEEESTKEKEVQGVKVVNQIIFYPSTTYCWNLNGNPTKAMGAR